MLAAIEIYNKPDFRYREETFAILALNAWELLLKAVVLATSGDPRSLYVYDVRTNAQGTSTTKKYLKRNRSGNPRTIGLGDAITRLDGDAKTRLPKEVKANLEALIAIRDNAVHFVAAGPMLAKEVLEIGTASVKNYIELSRRLFATDFSAYNLFLMPIGFLPGSAKATALVTCEEEQNLLKYITALSANDGQGESGFHVALTVNLAFKKSATAGAIVVSTSRDAGATTVRLTEENIRETWPWDYKELSRRLRLRYSDFVVNTKYHEIRKPLEADERFARIRYLDPANPNSGKKIFFNPNILGEFDKHYTTK